MAKKRKRIILGQGHIAYANLVPFGQCPIGFWIGGIVVPFKTNIHGSKVKLIAEVFET